MVLKYGHESDDVSMLVWKLMNAKISLISLGMRKKYYFLAFLLKACV
jgi:hypothetical protein